MEDQSQTQPDQATSTLGAVAGGIPLAAQQAEAAVTPSQPAPSPQQPTQAPTQSGSRLSRIISAVANVADTALASVPDKGRQSFLTGAGEGARAEQANIANQQAIKFRTFDDSVRAAQLHNQDLEIQARTQAQADAHQASQDAQHDWDEAHGLEYTEIPNSGQAATDYLTAQTGNGGASIPAGTHLSADGKTILIPKQSSDTQAALLKKYQTFASAYNLPSLPDGAKFVPGKFTDYLQNKLEGKNLDGSVIKHDDLQGAIADLQTTRDNLAKKGNTDPNVLSQIDGTIGHLKENQTALDAHQAGVFKTQQAQQLDTLNKSEAIKAKYAEQKQDNAAADKASATTNGNWLPKVGADEKKKAELAENIAFNANEVASIVMRRPDILGAVAGRFTNAQQMIGDDDPDISALGVHVHNMAMANSGVHGFRSQEGVESYERQLLNNFKNGPAAMAGLYVPLLVPCRLSLITHGLRDTRHTASRVVRFAE